MNTCAELIKDTVYKIANQYLKQYEPCARCNENEYCSYKKRKITENDCYKCNKRVEE